MFISIYTCLELNRQAMLLMLGESKIIKNHLGLLCVIYTKNMHEKKTQWMDMPTNRLSFIRKCEIG